MLRRTLPVYSPISPSTIVAGWRNASPRARNDLAGLVRQRTGAVAAFLTGTGTQALTLAIRAAGRPGRPPRVALPGFGCFDLVSAAVGADAQITFYDVDPASLNPDQESVARALADDLDAIVVVHHYGVAADIAGVRAAAARASRPIAVIEDAAQAFGLEVSGRAAGAFGDLAVFSFGRGKGWTGGNGGALVASGAEWADRARVVGAGSLPDRATGTAGAQLFAQWLFGFPSLFGVVSRLPWLHIGETPYHDPKPPRSIGQGAAGVLLAGYPAAVKEASFRWDAGDKWYTDLLGHPAVTVPVPPPSTRPGWLRFPLVLATPELREAFCADQRVWGVMPMYPMSLDRLPAVRARLIRSEPLTGAAALVSRGLTLPTHSRLGPVGRGKLRSGFESAHLSNFQR